MRATAAVLTHDFSTSASGITHMSEGRAAAWQCFASNDPSYGNLNTFDRKEIFFRFDLTAIEVTSPDRRGKYHRCMMIGKWGPRLYFSLERSGFARKWVFGRVATPMSGTNFRNRLAYV
jgi:hypothetical protein